MAKNDSITQMTNQTMDYITEEKRKELEHELEELKGPKRKKLLENLEYAKSLGDLKENAEYHQVREDHGKLEERILKIEQILQSSQVVTNTSGDIVGIGSKVVVEREGSNERKTYSIVGSEEANMSLGKISNRSPMGEALFGKKKGDRVSFNAPSGIIHYKILSVS